MKRTEHILCRIPVAVVALLVFLRIPHAVAQEEAQGGLAALVKTLPEGTNFRYEGPDRADAARLWDDIWKGGAASVVALVDMIDVAGPSMDFQPRYALHGIVTHLGQSGRDADRQKLVAALASTLAEKRASTTKAIVLRELLHARGREAVAAVGTQLLDAELCEYATQALSSFGGAESASELRMALPKASGLVRRTVIRGLGEVRDAQSVPAVTEALTDPERDTRIVAADALAEIGSAASAAPLLKATEASAIMEKGLMYGACLRLVRRLTEDGKKAEAETFALQLYAAAAEPANVHVRCVALARLSQTGGEKAIETIAAACRSENSRIATVGVRSAADMAGREMAWLQSLANAKESTRARFVLEVGRNAGPATTTVLLAAMRDAAVPVRVAAIDAVKGDVDTDIVSALLPFLGDSDGNVRGTATKALRRVTNADLGSRLASAMTEAEATVKREIIGVLASRVDSDQADAVAAEIKSSDGGVRSSAIHALGVLGSAKHSTLLIEVVLGTSDGNERNAAGDALAKLARRSPERANVVSGVIAAANGAAPEGRAALIRVLGRIADGTCLDTVLKALGEDENAKDAAVRALADWPEPDALDHLKRLVKEAEKPTHRVLALRGAVRLTDHQARERAREQLVADYRELMGLAERPDDRKMVLGAVAKVEHADALEMARAALDDKDLTAEAEAACLALADKLRRNKDVREQVKAVLTRLSASANEKTAKRAKEQLEKLGK